MLWNRGESVYPPAIPMSSFPLPPLTVWDYSPILDLAACLTLSLLGDLLPCLQPSRVECLAFPLPFSPPASSARPCPLCEWWEKWWVGWDPPRVVLAALSVTSAGLLALAGALAVVGTGMDSIAAMPPVSSALGRDPTAGRKGQGKKKSKSPAQKAKPPVVGTAASSAALPLATAPAAHPLPFLSPALEASSLAPREYAQVAVACLPTTLSSTLVTASSSTSGGQGPFSTLTRKQCPPLPTLRPTCGH